MSFPLFLRGMLLVLVVFAITTYVVTQSLWTTVINTALCAVLVQAGYFVGVLVMVWRSRGSRTGETTAPEAEANQASKTDGEPSRPGSRVTGTPRSGQL